MGKRLIYLAKWSVRRKLRYKTHCAAKALCRSRLIAHLSDSALQAHIAATSRRLLQLGQDILGGKRTMRIKRVLPT